MGFRFTVENDEGTATVTALGGLVQVDGSLPDEAKTEIRNLLNERGDSSFAEMRVSYSGGNNPDPVHLDPHAFTDLWLAIVLLNELPAKGYLVGVVAEGGLAGLD